MNTSLRPIPDSRLPFKALPAVLGVLLIASSGCGGGESAAVERTPASEAAPVAIEIVTAELEAVPQTTRASGSTAPWRRVMPGTKILGRVDEVLVREGDRVSRGGLLARLEKRDLEAAVAQAEAAVAMAEARLEQSRAHSERMSALFERGSVTEKNLEDATAGFRVAEAGLEQARANLAAAQVTLGYAEIRSPVAGWVVEKRVETGDMAQPGAPLFTIEDLSKVKISARVPEADVVGLEEGAPARITVLAREIEARVDRVIPAGDPASRTFTVELVVDNPDGELKSGMFARVEFERGEERVLRVPATSIVERGQLEGVFVAGEDGRVRLRWVKTGRRGGADGEERVVILSGLVPGERIVADPPPGLVDGAAYSS